jgi:ubiquinol oxidase
VVLLIFMRLRIGRDQRIALPQYQGKITAAVGRVIVEERLHTGIGVGQEPAPARLREVIVAVRADEAGHRDVNHALADKLDAGGGRLNA